MKPDTRILFISSTGGHLTELLQLAPLFAECDYYLITEKTKANEVLRERYGRDRFFTLLYGSRSQPVSYVLRILINSIRSVYYYYRIRPDYVITTGTHTAVPMCRIAHRHHKKVIWIETIANSQTPTLAGRMVYPIADLFIVQWESMLKVYPKAVYGGWIF